MIGQRDKQIWLGLSLTTALVVHSAVAIGLLSAPTKTPHLDDGPLGFEMVMLAANTPPPPTALPSQPTVAPPPPVSEPVLPLEPAPPEPLIPEPVVEQTVQPSPAPEPRMEPPDPQVEQTTVATVAQEAFSSPSVAAVTEAAPTIREPMQSPRSDAAYLNNAKPHYPHSARRRKLEGVVLLEVLVSAHGEAKNVAVKQSSGHGVLDQAARSAVEKWRFVPAANNGIAIAATVEVPIRFALND